MKPRTDFVIAWLVNYPVPEDKIANEQPLMIVVRIWTDYQARPCQNDNLVAP